MVGDVNLHSRKNIKFTPFSFQFNDSFKKKKKCKKYISWLEPIQPQIEFIT